MANNAAPVGVDGRNKHGRDGIPTAHALTAKFSFPFSRICARFIRPLRRGRSRGRG